MGLTRNSPCYPLTWILLRIYDPVRPARRPILRLLYPGLKIHTRKAGAEIRPESRQESQEIQTPRRRDKSIPCRHIRLREHLIS